VKAASTVSRLRYKKKKCNDIFKIVIPKRFAVHDKTPSGHSKRAQTKTQGFNIYLKIFYSIVRVLYERVDVRPKLFRERDIFVYFIVLGVHLPTDKAHADGTFSVPPFVTFKMSNFRKKTRFIRCAYITGTSYYTNKPLSRRTFSNTTSKYVVAIFRTGYLNCFAHCRV